MCFTQPLNAKGPHTHTYRYDKHVLRDAFSVQLVVIMYVGSPWTIISTTNSFSHFESDISYSSHFFVANSLIYSNNVYNISIYVI